MRCEILARMTAIVADDIERRVGVGSRDRRKGANQIDDVAAVEERADVQNSVGIRDRDRGLVAEGATHQHPASPSPYT